MIIITRTRLTVVVSLVVLVLSSFVSPVFGTASTTATKSVPLSPPPPPVSSFVSDSNDNHGTNNANTTTAAAAAAAVVIPEWKRVLPYPLNNKTQSLRRILVPGPHTDSGSPSHGQRHQDHVEVILLGTAHVSKDSCRDVRVLLETIKPTVVFIEMCTARIPMMLPSNTDNQNQNQNPAGGNTDDEYSVEEDIINKEDDEEESKMKEKESFLDRLSSSLSFFRRRKYSHAQENTDEHIQIRKQRPSSLQNTASKLLEKMQSGYADSLGVELGGEFRVAYQYWDEQQRQEVVNQSPLPSPPYLILGDRPVSLTLTRAWESLRVWGKLKLIVGLLLSSFQKPNSDELKEWIEQILSGGDDDIMSKSIEELAKHFPSLKRVIIEERDAYMACKVYQTCRHLLLLPSDDLTTTTTNTNNNNNNNNNNTS